MAALCFVTTCMGRLAFLRRTLEMVACQPASSCVVVDYSCPDRCGEWVARHYPQMRVVRVEGQATFRLAHARNQGAAAADARWLCFVDADILLAPSFVGEVLPILQAPHYYRPHPKVNGADGTFLCGREEFEQIGGYDDVYAGYGVEDNDIYTALEFAGFSEKTFPGHLLRHLPHGNDLRVAHYAVKDFWQSVAINRVYRDIKFELMGLSSAPLSREVRSRLYTVVTSEVTSWYRRRESERLNFHVSVADYLPTIGGDRVLRYGIVGVPADGPHSR